ncbi:hypothetical protein CMI47_13090 [Candidatus Pacearchaeota archaeon]|nr:hypothetical protein [Candidatus Pacearchaeota archaeon]|tara:strand:+ start:21557 stop:22168 length:612 start_codon:yes stop_codon:yes gene_type:complete
MKSYPSILGPQKAPNLPCIAFDKIDGSQIRAVWSRKREWYKFGTRKRLFDKVDKDFGCAIKIFQYKFAESIVKIIKRHKKYRDAQTITAFCEFFGENSFAGNHYVDDEKDLILFDVAVHKHGILGPKEFIDLFGNLDIPEIIYTGNLNKQFINDILEGRYPVTFEGVVCKSGTKHDLWMRKIKTKVWLTRLKEKHPDNYDELK